MPTFNRDRTYALQFEGTELAGLEASMLPLSIGGHIQFESWLNSGRALTNDEIADFCGAVADRLSSWNYEADGQPVPPTRDGLLEHVDLPFLMLFVVKWLAAISGVAVPLALAGQQRLTPETLERLESLTEPT